jgi:hypothetical protein
MFDPLIIIVKPQNIIFGCPSRYPVFVIFVHNLVNLNLLRFCEDRLEEPTNCKLQWVCTFELHVPAATYYGTYLCTVLN